MAGLSPTNRPRAHQRPSIDLDRTVTREWRTIPVSEVQDGDTVVDIGLISARGVRKSSETGEVVKRMLVNHLDEQKDYAPDATVFAFVKVRG